MANYKQEQIAGESYVRANAVLLENPKNGAPRIVFTEERWYDLGNGIAAAAPVGQLAVPFEPSARIDILDPDTGAATGITMTQAQVYAAIYSVYIASAIARDAQAAG